MLEAVEGDNCKGGAVLRLHLEFLFETCGSCTCPALLAARRLGLWDTIRESTLFLKLLGPADESQRHLRVGADRAAQGLGGQDSVCEFFAGFCRRDEALGSLWVVLIEILKPIEEAQIETGGLRSIVDKEGWVFSPLTHVQGSKVQGALLATSFFENDREVLLHACGRDFNRTGLLLASNTDMQESGNEIWLCGRERHSDPADFFWLNTELPRLNFKASSPRRIGVELDMSSHPAFVLKLDLFVLCCLDGDESEVDKWLKLHIWRWS